MNPHQFAQSIDKINKQIKQLNEQILNKDIVIELDKLFREKNNIINKYVSENIEPVSLSLSEKKEFKTHDQILNDILANDNAEPYSELEYINYVVSSVYHTDEFKMKKLKEYKNKEIINEYDKKFIQMFELYLNSDYELIIELLSDYMKNDNYSLYINNLGFYYDIGKGVKKNINKAFYLYQQSALLGNATAIFNLALCYENGVGVKKDEQMAIKLFEKSAELKNPTAMCSLADIYNGKDNYIESFQLYKKAAELGDIDALVMTGYCYICGDGVEKNKQMAIELLSLAIELGSNEALDILNNNF